jgi:hypothetical protein
MAACSCEAPIGITLLHISLDAGPRLSSFDAREKGRIMNVQDFVVKIVTVPDMPVPDTDQNRSEALVKRECSRFLTPEHIDVTDQPIRYAIPKKFPFPSEKQMRWMDANRWMRRQLNDKKVTSVYALLPVEHSINNLNDKPIGRF